jgi:alpha-amylase
MRKPPLRVLALAALPLSAAACFNVDSVSTRNVHLTSQVQDWRDEMIYQVLVDRFSNGDFGNDWRVDRTSLARYQGGDWQGLINHLDYFQALGVTTLWISPIVRNVDTDAGIDGYHGYWASDLAELNPHFGDLATLRLLVQECHRRHLRVVLDIVTNHMGQMFYYDINQNGRPDDNVYGGGPSDGFQNPGGMGSTLSRVSEYDPDYNTEGVVQSFTSLGPAGPAPVVFFDMPDIFRTAPRSDQGYNQWQWILARPEGYHRRGRIVVYNNTNHQPDEQVLTGDFPGGLKDVATENPDVRHAMIEAYARWVELLDLDGFRIDTLKHVEHDFWSEFAPAIRQRLAGEGKSNFFMFGEAFDGDDQLIGSYTQPDEMDSVFYFSQKYNVYQNVFQCEGPTHDLEGFYAQRAMHFGGTPQPMGANAPPQQLLVNFFDNHDVPRFLAGVQRDDTNPGACPAGHVNSDDDRAAMKRKLFAALAYQFTEDGVPCVYYGTEQDFHGANDPSNREVLWETARDYQDHRDAASQFRTDGDTFQWIARLARVRRAYGALRRGSMAFKWTTTRTGTEQDAGVLAFERGDGDQTVLVVINAHSAGPSETSATSVGGGPMTTSFPAGTELVDVLGNDGASFTVGAGGSVTVRVDPWQARVLVPREQVMDLGM